MKVDKVTTSMLRDIRKGQTMVYDLPDRGAYESAKANIYRWSKMQDPQRTFTVKLSEESIMIVTRKS